MNQVKFLLLAILAILAFSGTGCNDDSNAANSQNPLSGTDVDSRMDVEVPVGTDSSNISMDDIDIMDNMEFYLINSGMANNGATVIRGEDGEFCVVDEPLGTCYKLTLADTRWKLIEVSIIKNDESAGTVDYSDKNIIYEFKENDKLIVSGKIDDSLIFEYFKEGEHSYYYGMMIACQLCTPAPNLTISDSPGVVGQGHYVAYFDDTKMHIAGRRLVGWVDGGNGPKDTEKINIYHEETLI